MKEKIGIDTNSGDFLELDALFSNARENAVELELVDDNFTKLVVNSLPAKPARRDRKSLPFDLLGMILGLVMAYLYFDVSLLLSDIINLVPETIVLSPMHALAAFASVSVMSLFAWWVVEKGRTL